MFTWQQRDEEEEQTLHGLGLDADLLVLSASWSHSCFLLLQNLKTSFLFLLPLLVSSSPPSSSFFVSADDS